ncbi:MAG: 50S ribosomal protein L9 [Clostridia bacterium]|jgi:large subunit ribosomal protein L9|nr:50S ribosomal protein L9 [Clostridia bacterium]MBQ1963302.1 50S ribosomal protein L9 [Clostridia bacterium]MBQ5834411.1 50S ribosomal protein L9 [Clostridia bacterium]
MKVILLADVKGQGKKNDVIEVSDGYAKNFLIPRKLAKAADAQSLNDVKVKEAARLYRIETEKKAAKELAEQLKSVLVKIPTSGGTDGRLYGSVTSKDIVEKLKADTGIDIDKRKVVLNDPIKAYGKYEVEVKLYTEITGKIYVLVCEK